MTETQTSEVFDGLGYDPFNQTVVASDIPLHPEDEWLGATIDDIVPVQGQYGPQLRWEILLDEEADQGNGAEGADRKDWYFTGPRVTTNERNKLRQVIKWLTGEFPEQGEQVDLRAFIGMPVRVMFERYEKDGQTRDRIYRMKPKG